MDIDPQLYEKVAINEADLRKIVLSYLIHNCYKETAEAFSSSTGMKRSTDLALDIDKRKPIYTHVMDGDILKAIALTNELAPDLLANNKEVHFNLLTLHFIDLVRAKNSAGALRFAQDHLRPFGKHQCFLETLQDCMALLAYNEPETSPMVELLTPGRRQRIADSLNRAVLAHANLPGYASLERLIQQTGVVRQKLKDELGKDGPPPFKLEMFLLDA